MFALLSALAVSSTAQLAPPRFESVSPLPGLPPIMADAFLHGEGIADALARQRGLQARILWIDCTANIDRYNTEDKIVALVERIARAGFNTVVFDVKPISGQVIWPSQLAPRLTEWRGRQLPPDFDPVGPMVREARKRGLRIYASLNAFSEGHRMFLAGPGYERKSQQTVLYEATPYLYVPGLDLRQELMRTLNRADDTGRAVSIHTTLASMPEAADAFVLTLDRGQRAVDGFEGAARGAITIPRGGTALYGRGEAANFLRNRLVPGLRVEVRSDNVFVPISERPEQQIPLMMNPNDPEVRIYALAVLEELARGYEFDGFVYDDRLRYGGMNADFSETTRALYEKRVGRPLRWPQDVFRWTFTPTLERGIEPGPLYADWMAWRASVMRDFLVEARAVIQKARRGALLGVYAGSWYGEYPAIGSNWASREADAGFWFLTPEYAASGFANDIDFLITGCYYPTPTIFEAMRRGREIGHTVEMGGYLSNRMVRDATWIYAGIMLMDYPNDPEGFANALQAAVRNTQGVMVFDLSHDIDKYWEVFERAFAVPATPPHVVPGLLSQVRRQRERADRAHPSSRPTVIAAGKAGTGQ